MSGTGEGLRRISYDHYSEGSHLPLPEKVNLRAICSWQKGSASTASLRFPPAPRWSHAVLLPHLVSPHPDGHTPLQDPQSRGSSLGRRMPCSQKIPEEAKPGAFLQARLWASPSRRAEALGQHSGHCCQGELRKRQSTVQTGEDPRECCRGTSGGWHEWSHAPWLPRRDHLHSSQDRSGWKWTVAQTWGTQHIEQLHWGSSGHLGSLDPKAGQEVSPPFLVNCQRGNTPLATVESWIQSSVLGWWLTFFPWTIVLSQPVAYLFYGLNCRRKSGLLRFWALAARTITCFQVQLVPLTRPPGVCPRSQVAGLPHGISGALE